MNIIVLVLLLNNSVSALGPFQSVDLCDDFVSEASRFDLIHYDLAQCVEIGRTE